jgi:hypothetical protein
MMRKTGNWAVRRALSAVVGALICAVALATLPNIAAAAPAAVTSTPFAINFNSVCAGEVIAMTGTLHLVNLPGGGAFPDHGNWSNATAVGLTTGTEYRVTSASLLIDDPNVYLTHFSFTSSGPDGITWAATFIGPLGGAPTDLIEVQCN